jgi:hypothetical protein
VRGALVCRRHGANANVLRNADMLTRLRQARAALPYLEEWTWRLIAEHERYLARLADGGQLHRCRARRTDGQPCGCWSIRGGYVCRVHGGSAPQVRAKADARLEASRIYQEFARGVGRTVELERRYVRP